MAECSTPPSAWTRTRQGICAPGAAKAPYECVDSEESQADEQHEPEEVGEQNDIASFCHIGDQLKLETDHAASLTRW